jgi:hypothetical protein
MRYTEVYDIRTERDLLIEALESVNGHVVGDWVERACRMGAKAIRGEARNSMDVRQDLKEAWYCTWQEFPAVGRRAHEAWQLLVGMNDEEFDKQFEYGRPPR